MVIATKVGVGAIRGARRPRTRPDTESRGRKARSSPAEAQTPEGKNDIVRTRDARGRRGFGHTQDRRHIVPNEAELIRQAAQDVLSGATLSSIVDGWNRRGVTTTTGGPWRINALSALLIQPRLAGLGPSGASGPDAGAPVPAILDEGTHNALIALRRARGKNVDREPGRSGRQYLLTGLLRCWRCGSRLGGITPRGSSVRPHYRCPSRGAGGCSGVVVHASHTDDAVRSAILDRIDDPAFACHVESKSALLAAEEETMTALVADAVMGRHQHGDAIGLWTDGPRIDGQAWGQLKEVLEARASSSESELARQTLLGRQRELCGTGEMLRACWDGMDLLERRSVIEAVVDHFVVLPAPRLRSQFTSERLQPVWLD